MMNETRQDNTGKIYKLVQVQQKKGKKTWSMVYDRDCFTLPNRIYGDVISYTERIVDNYHRFYSQTGCLFLGPPGSGKTLQAKHVCNRLLQDGYDVLYLYGTVNNEAIDFLNETTFQGVIYIDEAAKVLNGSVGIDKLLTTMSDESYHRCWIFTENQSWRLPRDILERPGRMLFKRNYNRITDDVIREACEDFGAGPLLADELIERNRYCKSFTLDTLISLLEVHIRFPDLTMDDLTEKFAFDMLRMNLVFRPASIFYKDVDITRHSIISDPQPSGGLDPELAIFVGVNTKSISELNRSVLVDIMRKNTKLFFTFAGKFTEERFEEWVKNGVLERREPTMLPSMQPGDTGMMQPPGIPKFDKATMEALKQVSSASGYALNLLNCVNDTTEDKLIFFVSPSLRVELPYETSLDDAYANNSPKWA